MSRSWNQHHPTAHSKRNRFPARRRPWKMRPHGIVQPSGYGGWKCFRGQGVRRYSAHPWGDYLFPVINKTRARHQPIPRVDPGVSDLWVTAWDMVVDGELSLSEFHQMFDVVGC